MNVSVATQSAYKRNSVHKKLILEFPRLKITIPHEQIYSESMRLKESIMDSNRVEFVGCISSMFEVQVHGIRENLKNELIKVSIKTDDTEPIPLFQGYVDSAKMQSNRNQKKITAYDVLYTKGETDVASWYKSITFPTTLKAIRDSLFRYIGVEQVQIDLPNDNVTIDRQYEPNVLQSLSVIKAICQINGAFGIINRKGKFEYRILGAIEDPGTYPSETLFPGPNTFPGAGEISGGYNDVIPTDFSFYRKVDYDEYVVKPVDKLTIRQTENDAGVTFGEGENNYIIQGNMFTYGLSTEVLAGMAKSIYPNVQGFSYYPFTSINNGLPYLECGVDAVSYVMIDYDKLESRKKSRSSHSEEIPYKEQSFYILNRELSGIQALKDSYSAQGEEYQTEFITDLQTQIDIIKRNTGTDIKDYAYGKDYIDNNFYDTTQIDDMFANFEGDGGLKVESVLHLPSNPDENTIYLIQGMVTVE